MLVRASSKLRDQVTFGGWRILNRAAVRYRRLVRGSGVLAYFGHVNT